MKKIAAYAFPLVWLLIGPNLVWQLFSGGFNLLRPLNVTFLALALIGTITSLFGMPVLRIIAGVAGVLLGILNAYIVWAIGGFSQEASLNFSVNF